ncbi:MAG: hypothetical protein LLF89_01520 [Spirochaetaceae bacterium]|nr:hypothetical protein [Spirochaetaceae bacterium]
MNAKRFALTVAMAVIAICAASSQESDAKNVTPAWITEKQFGQAASQEAPVAAKASNAFSVFFIGYDYPTLSVPLATHLTPGWASPYNFSLGFESCTAEGSAMLNGLEMELFITSNNSGLRFLMNDMVMIGYSFDLKPVRFNLGGRLGLSVLDVNNETDASDTYSGLGFVLGPEASLYAALDPSFWLWLRARYSMSWYMSLDSGTTPISSGDNSLDCLSIEAGLAFKL